MRNARKKEMRLVIPVRGLPVPAVRGGAVQRGIQQIIDENEKHALMQIVIFSVDDPEARMAAQDYQHTRFVFIKPTPIRTMYFGGVNKALKKVGIKYRFRRYSSFLRQMIKNLKGMEYDYILIKNTIEFVLPLRHVTKGKIILQLHNDFLNSGTINSEKIYQACAKILVNSNYIRKRVLSVAGSDSSKVLVQKNCTDTQIFDKSLYKDTVGQLRQQYGIQDDDVVIFYSGRIIKAKGVAELIQAVKRLPSEASVKLMIVGSRWFGKTTRDRYLTLLERLSADLEDQVIYTGYVGYEQLPRLHALADIAVIPSLWEEPAGRVVIEAESSGIPVVVSDAGGIGDYICEQCAIVVPRGPDFITGLGRALELLVSDPAQRDRMGQAGSDYAQSFNPRNYYMGLVKILEDE
jgi:glycosyltransferase involved in cell wall biosynthesis